MTAGRGPLAGLRVVEFDGLGPVPFAAMLLADLGAEVVRLRRPGKVPPEARFETYHRGRPAVEVDLKDPAGSAAARRLVATADALIEGFRPGVMERLGLGPQACAEANPALVYCRMTGWGQEGPYAGRAGHDINYLAVSGVLDSCRRAGGRPVPPVNFLADFGGGALYLVIGMLAALRHAVATGVGQVVDAAMIDGTASFLTSVCGRLAGGSWRPEPGTNLLDTGAHFYEVYETGDGRHVAVGAIEPRFYGELVARLGLDAEELPEQFDRDSWPAMKQRFEVAFRTRTRAEWSAIFAGTDACVTPVLSLAEAQRDPHVEARGTYGVHAGIAQPRPAPRFGATPTALPPAAAEDLPAWAAAPLRGDPANDRRGERTAG